MADVYKHGRNCRRFNGDTSERVKRLNALFSLRRLDFLTRREIRFI